MATQMQLEVILAGNRIATASCKATKESIKKKTESGNCFRICVV